LEADLRKIKERVAFAAEKFLMRSLNVILLEIFFAKENVRTKEWKGCGD
jgi:hypothetical protein